MRVSSLQKTGLLLVALYTATASSQENTAQLAARLTAVRGDMWLPPHEYDNLRTEYLAWVDARVKAGQGLESMNRELKKAGLLPTWPDNVDEMDKSHAGYLEAIKKRQVLGTTDAFVIEAGMYKGAGCSLDVTAVVYERGSLTKLAEINAAPSEAEYAYYLSGVDISGKDAMGRRLVASGWVISNCTSTWNGKRIRIDQLKRSSMRNILAHDLYAHDRYGVESVAAQVQRDIVTFRYDGGIQDPDLLSTPAVAKYRIAEGRAVREAPIAMTRAGFIQEWLSMTDGDFKLWAEPQAIEMRSTVAPVIHKHGFEWSNIGRCEGSPSVWEVAVRVHDLEKLYILHISGDRATELRMLSIGESFSESCIQDDPAMNLTSVARELPW